jgi:exodeoxyribonuclease V alpha subunit
VKILEEIKFKCIPVTERYYSNDSSYGVFVFHTKDDIPKYDEVPSDPFYGSENKGMKMSILAGNMQQLYVGSEYEVVATLEYNNKYKNYQYKPKSIVSVVPKTEEQQRQFLESIITQRQANILLEQYPNIVQDIINGTDNVDLSILKGIGNYTYNSIKEKVLNNYVISDILVMLQPLGVTFNKIKKLISNEPNPSLLKEKLIDNPYIMLEIRGFGFKTVDQLALKINPDIRISAKRVYAFLKYYLEELGNNSGHTWIDIGHIESAIRDNLIECTDVYKTIIENEKKHESILHVENNKIGLKQYFEKEEAIFEIVKELNEYDPLKISENEIEAGISKSESDQGFFLTDEQRAVVESSIKNNVVIITGSAGTGKTSISRAILNIYKQAGYSIACCALSAMAAQIITEATGFPSSTIHRLLGYGPNGFSYSHEAPLSEDVILVDECSMINVGIFYAIISAVQGGKKIIMCGDNRQLPPIGYGNVFGDLLEFKENFSVYKLTKVLRQAEKSGILMDANKIRRGVFPINQPELRIINGELRDMIYMFRDSREALQNIAIKTYMKSIEEDGLDNTIIITPRREKCNNSALEINKKITDLLFTKSDKHMQFGERIYYVGSKVMQTDNNYEKNVFNGEIGYITSIYDTEVEGKNVIQFDVEFKLGEQTKMVTYNRNELDQLDLAYAATVHKVQGSGYKNVIIIIDMTHYTLLDTCMLYTAITRAKKRCLLLAEPAAFKMCMTNNKSISRQTWLSLRE